MTIPKRKIIIFIIFSIFLGVFSLTGPAESQATYQCANTSQSPAGWFGSSPSTGCDQAACGSGWCGAYDCTKFGGDYNGCMAINSSGCRAWGSCQWCDPANWWTITACDRPCGGGYTQYQNGCGQTWWNYTNCNSRACPTCSLSYTGAPNGLNSPYDTKPVVGYYLNFSVVGGSGATSTAVYGASAGTQNWYQMTNGTSSNYLGSSNSWDYVCNAYNANTGAQCSSNPICANGGCWSIGYADCGANGRIQNLSAYNCGGWGACNSSCGGTQTKTCTNNYGTISPSQSCNTTNYPCSFNAQCGTNTTCTTYTCNSPGTCSAYCSSVNHPVNGVCNAFGAWYCSDSTTKAHTRTYTAPSCGGSDVSCSPLTETISCNDGNSCTTDTCSGGACVHTNVPVNGGWSGWSNTGSCGTYQTCGQRQDRTCTNPTPACGGAACTGVSTQYLSCGTIACNTSADCNDGNSCTTDSCNNAGLCTSSCSHTNNPVNGVCNAFGGWYCSDSNTRAHTRTYTAPSCGGSDVSCSPLTETISCNDGNACTTDSCSGGACVHTNVPVNGGWSGWSNTGSCGTYQTCGQRQDRTCTNPTPACNGSACSGASTQYLSCGTIACNTSTDCNDGNSCTTDTCSGTPGTCTSSCSHTNNPVNGVCNAFGAWYCSDSTTKAHTRTYTAPSCGGSDVSCSPLTETISCNDGNACTTDSCSGGVCSNTNVPVNGGWSGWSNTGACGTYQTCGQRQDRTCTNPTPACGGAACSGASTQYLSCGTIACNTNADCNDGNSCTTDSCNNAGLCTSSCSHTNNPVNGVCNAWGAWSCSGNSITHSRTYTAPSCGGSDVSCSPLTETISCNDGNACTTDTCSGGACVYTAMFVTCSSDADCNDNNACTTDTCVNPGSCTSYCSHSNPPTSSAGVVQSVGSITSGSGNISQGGCTPGYRMPNYSSGIFDVTAQKVVNASYDSLLSVILKNSGYYTAATLDADANCSGGGVISTPSFNIYCYTTSTFDAKLGTAITDGTAAKTMVLYPKGTIPPINLDQTIITARNIAAGGKKIIVFVNGNLTIGDSTHLANITIPSANTTSGIIFVINGNLTTDPTISILDGMYVFSGGFDDGSSQTAITGNGSLLSTGTGNITFNRTTATNVNAAEHWTYEPKYLILFENSLASTNYTWKELSPQ